MTCSACDLFLTFLSALRILLWLWACTYLCVALFGMVSDCFLSYFFFWHGYKAKLVVVFSSCGWEADAYTGEGQLSPLGLVATFRCFFPLSSAALWLAGAPCSSAVCAPIFAIGRATKCGPAKQTPMAKMVPAKISQQSSIRSGKKAMWQL